METGKEILETIATGDVLSLSTVNIFVQAYSENIVSIKEGVMLDSYLLVFDDCAIALVDTHLNEWSSITVAHVAKNINELPSGLLEILTEEDEEEENN